MGQCFFFYFRHVRYVEGQHSFNLFAMQLANGIVQIFIILHTHILSSERTKLKGRETRKSPGGAKKIFLYQKVIELKKETK
jgi:hypothetical protein